MSARNRTFGASSVSSRSKSPAMMASTNAQPRLKLVPSVVEGGGRESAGGAAVWIIVTLLRCVFDAQTVGGPW